MPIGVLGLRTGNEPFPCLFRGDICDFSSQISPLFSLFAKKSLLKKYVMKALYAKADELVIIVCYPVMNQ